MREIKRRIRSVKNTQQITKAMKMVAAAKLRRAQERAEQAKPYAAKMAEVLSSIAKGTKDVSHPMLEKREVKKTGYIVITSDRGLAGGYNTNILRKAATEMQKHQSQNDYAVFAVGRKAVDYFKRREYPIVGEITGVTDYPTFADIKKITSTAVGMYAEGIFDELYVVYNEFVTAVTQVPTVQLLLPLDNVEASDEVEAQEQEISQKEYIYDPSATEVLEELLPKYAETLIFNAILNAKASEHGARMTAMGSATDNASEMIKTLSLKYNRARQAAITQEISEIVGGANAL
ncbi:ATP synthase F1 subunit gamma [Desulfuribacillus alkaliarsenatis]|uniref:ATP synthase gamma chain n=1 Tax=Desulfuribacillus alkaliarsenatis TaxID=766136 RepID=A0A1E5G1T4_9FIRM|nr:ATP synthase F1 subunit gamma [Desulfuribacillus alkaliarsenatis]OEF96877.1 F0F1 ATP synthase subunit gamma [Desulfuribacillus alkaliarsenatis]